MWLQKYKGKVSLFAESLKYVIIEHDLIQQVPVPDKPRPQYFQHCSLIATVIDCIVSSDVLTSAHASLTDVF